MIRRFQCVLFLIFVSLVRGDDKELPIVANARELKKVDSNKIIWQRDGSTMSYIPSSEFTKSFWMDTTEVTVGQFKQFLQSLNINYICAYSKNFHINYLLFF